MTTIRIAPAADADVPLLLDLIRELAAYERQPDAVTADVDTLRASLFGPRPAAEALIAYLAGAAAYAIYFTSFSTWTGRPGIYLEDIFVRPQSGPSTGSAAPPSPASPPRSRRQSSPAWRPLGHTPLARAGAHPGRERGPRASPLSF